MKINTFDKIKANITLETKLEERYLKNISQQEYFLGLIKFEYDTHDNTGNSYTDEQIQVTDQKINKILQNKHLLLNDSNTEKDLNHIIDDLFKSKKKDTLSLRKIGDCIDNLYLMNFIPEKYPHSKKHSLNTLLGNYKKLLNIISDETLFKDSKSELQYEKKYIPLIMFLMVMSSEKKTFLNNLILDTQVDKLSYDDTRKFLKLLENFLLKYMTPYTKDINEI